jgi:hypothetical protein
MLEPRTGAELSLDEIHSLAVATTESANFSP